MRLRSGPRTRPAAGREDHNPAKFMLRKRIEGLDCEMGVALAKGEYERVVRLAEEQEKLLVALMI